jgi:mono/diheme cytochrome c family protein
MRARRVVLGTLVALAATLGPRASRAADPPPGTSAAGRQTYDRYCAQCHGEKGDGQGPGAPHLLPKPRDFTSGKYKLRTTPSGALPTDDDLEHVIREGMPYSSMPAWPQLSDTEVAGLVGYLKSFSPDFADPGRAPQPIALPAAPAWSAESAAKGKEIYASLGCANCHGASGRGEGPSAPTLKDDTGRPLKAADLTYRWTFRGGPRREDIFRRFSTGLNGTPMPSYFDSLDEAGRWALTDYVYSLGDGDAPGYATLVVATPLDDEIDLARGEETFAAAARARLPVVGQIMQPGRAFAPSATAVEVKAVYDQRRIAFLVRWHDIRADTQAHNAPTLAVPLADEELAPAEGAETDIWGQAAEPTGSSDDFWGEAEAPAAAADDIWGEPATTPAQAGAEFSDAVAIQLPAQAPTGVAKPYFLFGDAERPVDLWFLDTAAGRVRQFTGRGRDTLTPVEGGGEVEASASWADGAWSAVFARELRATGGVSFAEGQYVPVAFSVWDGTARERGNRRGLTQWFYVYLAPREKPSVVAPMARAFFGVLGLELVALFWIRRQRKGAAGAA